MADADDTRRRKRLYVISEAGRQSWWEWMGSPITGSDPEPTMLARVYLLGRLPQAERAECLAVIRARVDQDAERLASLVRELGATPVPDDLRDVAHYRRATLDYGLRAHALTAQWLDELARA